MPSGATGHHVTPDYVGAKSGSSTLASYKSGLLALTPTVVIIGFLLLIPAIYAVVMSIHDHNWTLAGFRALMVDKVFLKSVEITFSYSFLTVTLQLVLGVLTA